MRIKDIEKLSLTADEINALAVTSYVRNKKYIGELNSVLAPLYLQADSPLAEHLPPFKELDSIEDIISVFEQAIPANEVVSNGAIYTPEYIRTHIIEHTCNEVLSRSHKDPSSWLCADISCGCGAFLYSFAQKIRKDTNSPYSLIYKHLYGIDISATSVTRTKILLSLLALSAGETVDEAVFNLYVANTLSFKFDSIKEWSKNGGFDIVIGNPPYVRAKHIDEESRKLLPLWKVARVGNADLYLPFFEIGLAVLTSDGALGYITVNSFFKSVNARAFRSYIHNNHFSITILNFGQELIFKKKLAYTCLVFLSKHEDEGLHYARVSSDSIRQQCNVNVELIPFQKLDDHKGWNLGEKKTLNTINRIEKAGTPLSKYCIKNGIATLANDIFIFRPSKTDDDFHYVAYENELWPIEKCICKDIIKPNILKCEADIPHLREKLIFPYDQHYQVIEERFFKKQYPKTYAYLSANKEKLLKRDKGKFDYQWYEFGRTQAINYKGKKLMFPYMTDTPKFVLTEEEEMLIYCGYAFYDDSTENLIILKRVLESIVFYYYIRNTSKPYSTGYYSYAKNYLKDFSVPQFNAEDKQFLLRTEDRELIDAFLCGKYGLSLNEINK